MWLGNNITPLREEEWDEEEEEEADVPAPASPPVSPVNSRFILAFFFFKNKQFEISSQSLDMFGVHLEVNLSSMYGENIHVSHSAENTVLGLIFTPVRSFCLNCTAAGSCHPVQPGKPLSS